LSKPSLTTCIVSCNEADSRVDPSRYFNLSANTTSVVKTAGGRTAAAINSLYATDQSSRIGMIVVVQHTGEHYALLPRSMLNKIIICLCGRVTGCASSAGDVETNIRSDVAALKASPYVRNEIPIIGYLLDVNTGNLREVK
jgi:carbonic anhydrase